MAHFAIKINTDPSITVTPAKMIVPVYEPFGSCERRAPAIGLPIRDLGEEAKIRMNLQNRKSGGRKNLRYGNDTIQ